MHCLYSKTRIDRRMKEKYRYPRLSGMKMYGATGGGKTSWVYMNPGMEAIGMPLNIVNYPQPIDPFAVPPPQEVRPEPDEVQINYIPPPHYWERWEPWPR